MFGWFSFWLGCQADPHREPDPVPPDRSVLAESVRAFASEFHWLENTVLGRPAWQARAGGARLLFADDAVCLRPQGAEDWAVDLALVGFGREEVRAVTAPTVSVEGETLQLDRGDVREWYSRVPGGFEQGFDLLRRPDGDGDVSLRLRVDGATLHVSPQGVLAFTGPGPATLRFDGLLVEDADGKLLSSSFVAIGDLLGIRFDDGGARYPIHVDPLLAVPAATVLSADPAADQWFGQSVALSGDRMAVGAPFDFDLSSPNGRVYVFGRDADGAGSWGLLAEISPPAGALRFGAAVALSDERVVVGAPGTASSAGSAYVFGRDVGGTDSWGLEGALIGSAISGGDLFGRSVALSGAFVAVGAPGDDLVVTNGGSVAVLDVASRALVKTLTASDAGIGDAFGIAVAVDADRVLVGAGSKDAEEGGAYLFDRDDGGADVWGEVVALVAPAALGVASRFGDSVALDGGRALVGAPLADEGWAILLAENAAGPGAWGTELSLQPPGGVSTDGFGESVSLAEGLAVVSAAGVSVGASSAYVYEAATGFTLIQELAGAESLVDLQFAPSVSVSAGRIAVGDPGDDGLGSGTVYDRVGDGWTAALAVEALDPTADMNFGFDLDMDGDIVVVGAPDDDEAAPDAGAAFVFARDEGGLGAWGLAVRLLASVPQEDAQFGYSVAVSGTSVIVGAPSHDLLPLYLNTGVAALYGRDVGGADNWGDVAVLLPISESDQNFGYDVAIDGNWAVVGAPRNDLLAVDSGAIHFFSRNLGGVDSWDLAQVGHASDFGADDELGGALAIDGTRVVAGAASRDGGAPGEGGAYVWHLDGTWVEEALLVPAGAANGDHSGAAVAISGDLVVVGAPDADEGGASRGRAAVFRRTGSWVEEDVLVAPTPANKEEFGFSVSTDGARVAVGAPGVSADRGDVSLFERSGDGWAFTASLVDAAGLVSDRFGRRVLVNGADAVVSALKGDGVVANSGEVHFFRLDAALAPVVRDGSFVSPEDTPSVYVAPGVLTNAYDGNGDALVAELVADALHGQVEMTGLGGATYTPDPEYSGPDSFAFRATDGVLESNIGVVSITVTAVADAPTAADDAVVTAEDAPVAGNVSLNDIDPDSVGLIYALLVGPAGGLAFSADGSFVYTPDADYSGSDSFSYRVTDPSGLADAGLVSVTVTAVNDPPVAVADGPYFGAEDTKVAVGVGLGVLVNDSDIDSPGLTATLSVAPTFGSATVQTNGAFEFMPNPDWSGTDSFVVSVSDGVASTPATVTVQISAVDDPPRFVGPIGPYGTPEDTVLTVPAPGLLGGFTEPEGEGMSTAAIGAVVGGAVSVAGNGSFVFTPTADFFGTASFSVLACNSLCSVPQTVNITVAARDDGPRIVGVAGPYATLEDVAAVVADPGVLVAFQDPESELMTAAVSGPPVGGAVVLSPNGGFTFTPSFDFNGAASFQVVACDGLLCSAPLLVNVTVSAVDDAPRVVAVAGPYGTEEDEPLTVGAPGVLAAFADPEGEGMLAVSVGGTVGGAVSLASPGSFTFTPSADFVGVGSFDVQACDGALCSPTLRVNVTMSAVPDAPRLIGVVGPFGTDEDVPLVEVAPGILAAYSDPDGDELVASLVSGSPDGTVDVFPAGGFSFRPLLDFVGSTEFSAQACDPSLLCGTPVDVVVTVGGINDPPNIVGVAGPYVTDEDVVLEVGVPGVLLAFVDAEGDPMTAQLAAAPDPSLASIVLAADGSFVLTPAINAEGAGSLSVRACDSISCSPPLGIAFSVNALDDTPVVVTPILHLATVEDVAVLSLRAEWETHFDDVEGDSLVAQLGEPPNLGEVSVLAGGEVQYAPNPDLHGEDHFTVVACDASSCSEPVAVTVDILSVPDAPRAVAPFAGFETDEDVDLELEPPGLQVAFEDPDGDPFELTHLGGPALGTAVVGADGSLSYSPFDNSFGDDELTLMACGSDGCSAAEPVAVVVASVNDLPTPTLENRVVAGDEDIGNLALIGAWFTDVEADPLSYVVTVLPLHGAVIFGPSALVYTPVHDFFGNDSFEFAACDAQGCGESVFVSVIVSGRYDTPVFVGPIPPVVTDEDVEAVLDTELWLAAFEDVDGDVLFLSLVSPTDPAVGTVDLAGNRFYPAENASGLTSFTVEACDAIYCSEVVVVDVEVIAVDDPPVAIGGLDFVLFEDETLAIGAPGLLSVFEDVEGDFLTAFLGSSPPPDFAEVTVGTDGSFVIVPAPDAVGEGSFEVVVCGAQSCSAPLLVDLTILPIDDAPVGVADLYFVDEGADLDVDAAEGLLANDVEVDGDLLIAVLEAPSSSGTVVVESDGAFQFTSGDPDATDDVLFSYVVTDGLNPEQSVPVLLVVVPVDDVPTGPTGRFVALAEDSSVEEAAPGLLDGFVDVEDDALIATVATPPTLGTLDVQDDGSWSYSPYPDANGSDSFEIAVCEVSAPAVCAAPLWVLIDIAPLPDAPRAVGGLSVWSADEDVVLDVPAPGWAALFSDPDGDLLSPMVLTVPDPALVSLVLAPDGSATVTPVPDAVGNTSLGLAACDADSCSPEAFLSIEVLPVDDAPRAVVGELRFEGVEDVALVGNAPGVLTGFVDVDGDPLTAVLVQAPPVGVLEVGSDGSLLWNPAADFVGEAIGQVTACDAAACAPSVPLVVDVAPVGDNPVWLGFVEDLATDEDVPLHLDAPGLLGAFFDADGDLLELSVVVGLDPALGVLVLSESGEVDLWPAQDAFGDAFVEVKACDVLACTVPVAVAVRIASVDDPPRLSGLMPTWSTDEDVELVVAAPGILEGFLDVEGDPMVASSVDGLASVASDGSFSFLPAPDANGATVVLVAACGSGGCSPSVDLNIDVHPVNDAPRLVEPLELLLVDEDVPAPVLAAVDRWVDVDGDLVELSVAVVFGPIAAEVIDLDVWVTPLPDESGSAELSVLACGGVCALPVPWDVVVTPVDDAPRPAEDVFATVEDISAEWPAPGVLGNDVEVDGELLAAALVSSPLGLNVVLGSDGGLTVTPEPDVWGSFEVVYAASDGWTSVQATVVVEVAAVEDAPIVVLAPAYTTSEDESLVVNAPGLLLAFHDGDGPIEPVLLVPPLFGSLDLRADGSFTYVPEADAFGLDGFEVGTADGLASVQVIVDVLAVDDSPRVLADAAFVATEELPLVASLAPFVVEPDGELLSFVVQLPPASGELFVDADGVFTYSPDPDFFGEDSFGYTASDPGGASATGVVWIDVADVPDAPVALGSFWATEEDVPLVVAAVDGLLRGSFDADGDGLTAAIVDPPASGVIELAPDGGFLFTPEADLAGDVLFRWVVTDGVLSSPPVEGVIAVGAVDDPPRTQLDAFVVVQGEVLDVPAPGVLAGDFDPEGLGLVASLTTSTANGTLTFETDGGFVYTPDPLFVGADGFVYEASDGGLLSGPTWVDLSVTPANAAPLASEDVLATDEDTPLDLPSPGVLANDVDPEGLTLTVVNFVAAEGLLAIGADGSLHYEPPADFFGLEVITYEVSDPAGLTTLAQVSVDVIPVNDPPVAQSDSYDASGLAALNVPAEDGVLANDYDIDSVGLVALLVKPPTHGSLTLGEDGSLTFVAADDGFDGTDSFTYKADDGFADSEVTVVSVLVSPTEAVDPGCDEVTWYKDQDHDGYGDPTETRVECEGTEVDTYVLDRNDCDDADPNVHPDAEETPNDHIDQDCDGADTFVTARGGCACTTPGSAPINPILAALIGIVVVRRARRIPSR